jgi:hypothetical protein
MNYNILAIDNFKKEFKKLAKKYPSLKVDLIKLSEELELNPRLGAPIGKNCHKIRMAITSKGKGKSGGARVITLVVFASEVLYLLSIYDKSDKENISEDELIDFISQIPEE